MLKCEFNNGILKLFPEQDYGIEYIFPPDNDNNISKWWVDPKYWLVYPQYVTIFDMSSDLWYEVEKWYCTNVLIDSTINTATESPFIYGCTIKNISPFINGKYAKICCIYKSTVKKIHDSYILFINNCTIGNISGSNMIDAVYNSTIKKVTGGTKIRYVINSTIIKSPGSFTNIEIFCAQKSTIKTKGGLYI